MGAHRKSYGYGGAGIFWVSLYAAPAPCCKPVSDFVCRAVLLGVSRILDAALMELLQLLIGRDKYSISASMVGDEPQSAERTGRLIMPIANEDVSRVFRRSARATREVR